MSCVDMEMPQILPPLLTAVAIASALAALIVSWLGFRELRTSTEPSGQHIGRTSFLAVAGIGLGVLSIGILLTSR